MRILHVGPRSPFVDFLVGYFEQAAPGQNTVVQAAVGGGGGVAGTARAASGYAAHLARVVRAARSADVVVAHMLTLPSALAVVSAPARTYTVWSGWGVDYYGSGADDADGLLGPRTAELAAGLQLAQGPRGGRPVQQLTRALVERAVRRFDAFSAPVPDDLAVVRRRYPGFRGEYHQLNYADVGSFAARSAAPGGRDVLLGNSAFPANNHLEALERLSTLDLTGRRVLTPLTYGNAAYRAAVLERGHALLGDAFEPLVEPLPFDEYVERVSRCGVVVMNHHRQQGLGNVGIGLWSGAQVYLSRQNPLHAFLTRSGLDVLDLETATALPADPVQGAALEHRRALVRGIWGEDVVLDNVRELLAAAGRSGRA